MLSLFFCVAFKISSYWCYYGKESKADWLHRRSKWEKQLDRMDMAWAEVREKDSGLGSVTYY